ncbi:hypothetical protein Y71_15070 [Kosakonia radicincitans DSM 16656]|nr:hypothetical protein Y71_15070 [Kosakonia radicincitans DSM 16656]
MLEFLHNQQGRTMKSVTKPCPICGEAATSFKHVSKVVNISGNQPTIREVPSVVYVCDEHGWFMLSEQINDFVITSTDPSVKKRLAELVKVRFVPEQEQPLSLKAIESLD